eukprot:6591328-Pyramimonas_sp.AAC.1
MASKKPKLTSFGKESYVSHAALAALFDQVKREGLPDAFSPSTQARHRDELAGQQTSHGKLVQTLSVPNGDAVMEIPLQNPFAMLEASCSNSQLFKTFLEGVLSKS